MFATLRPTLDTCRNINQRLDAIRTFASLAEADWQCFVERRTSDIQDDALRARVESFAADTGILLLHTDAAVGLLGKHPELVDLPTESHLEEHYGTLWRRHVTSERQDCEPLLKEVESIGTVCMKWYERLSDKEDMGSTSSYSDYSDGNTSTSDDDDDGEETSDSRSK